MKDQRGFWLRVVAVLMLVLSSARAQTITSYFVNGSTLELRPPAGVAPTGILWKHDGDLLAEWVDGKLPLTYYGEYDGRTTLDVKTGHLVIRNMDETKDTGVYTLEINNQLQPQRYDAKAIKEVPKPLVWITPVACDRSLDSCSLTCEGGTAGAEPITYTWMMDGEELDEKKKEIAILKTETEHVLKFICRMENPVSEQESDPKDNPFYSEPPPPPPLPLFAILLILAVVLLIVLVLGYFAYRKKDFLKSIICPAQNDSPTNSAPAGGPKGPPTRPSETDLALLDKGEANQPRDAANS